MLTLYTPATGFPDLEVRIAYGLARIGIEARCDLELIPESGYYIIKFSSGDTTKMQSAFLNILRRLLSSERFYEVGTRPRYRKNYPASPQLLEILSKSDLFSLYNERILRNLNMKKSYFCGHETIPKFGGKSGLLLNTSFHAGQPYERDKWYAKFNQNLCAVCAYLAILGFYSFTFSFSLGKGEDRKYCYVLPIPKKRLTKSDLNALLSIQIRNDPLPDRLPVRAIPLILLAKVPSLCNVISRMDIVFHISLISMNERGTDVEKTFFADALNYAKFLSYSPFNIALVDLLIDPPSKKPSVDTLTELITFLNTKKDENLLKFARYLLQNIPNCTLHEETVKYFLKEVSEMNNVKEEIFSNQAVRNIARTLRGFVEKQKFLYVDHLRNAKTVLEVMDVFARMFREAAVKRKTEKNTEEETEEKAKDWIFIPSQADVEEVIRLMQESEESFRMTKNAIVLLALTFPTSSPPFFKSSKEKK